MNALSCLGSGLTMPFLIVYLHSVRGIALPTAGLLLALIGVAGIVATPLSGPLIDRIGSLQAFTAGLVVGGLGIGGFVFAHSPATALAPALVYGCASGLMWNGFATLLVELVPAAERGSVFALRYMTANVAYGAGALVSGLVTVSETPGPFRVILLADAASYVLFAGALLAVGGRLRGGSAPSDPFVSDNGPSAEPGGGRLGYRQVIADRALLGALLVNSLFMVFALSPSNSAYPAWVTGAGGSSTRIVGLGFALNISVLLGVQLLGIQFARGRERTRVAAYASMFFALSWLLIVLPVTLHAAGGVRDTVFVLALGIFAIGEALLSPTLPAVINDLAPDRLRGRYNAVFSLSNQIGPVAAPAISGAALGYGYGQPYLYALAGCCLVIGVLARQLGRVTPPAANLGVAEEERQPSATP